MSTRPLNFVLLEPLRHVPRRARVTLRSDSRSPVCECALVGVIAQVIGTLLLQLLLLFDTVIATVIAVASSNSTAASQDPACTRDPRHTHAAHGRGARRGNGPTVGGGGAERRRSERQGSSATSPRGGGACRGQGSAGCCARGEKRGRPHGQRAHKCAPAKPRRSAATPGGGDPSDADQEGQDDREADEDTRRRRP